MEFTLLLKGNLESITENKFNTVRADTSPKNLYIAHKGENLLFSINETPRSTVSGDDPILYSTALEFLKVNSLEDKFFNIYKEAYEEHYHKLGQEEQKRKTLKYLIGKLLEDLELNEIEAFLINHKNYDSFIGSKIKTKVEANYLSDGEGTIERTYTHKDYIGLVAVLIQQQLIAPVYLDYIPNINTKHGMLNRPNTLEVLGILKELGLMKPHDPIKRLLDYINAHILYISKGVRDRIVNIASNYKVTEDELGEYILAHILFKTLPTYPPICKVPGKREQRDIATTVFSRVTNLMMETATKTPNKINPAAAYNGEGKDSLYESNQVTTNISQADEAIMLVSVTADTEKDLDRMLTILFRNYGRVPTKEDFQLLHKHRKRSSNMYIRLEHIWLIGIISCVLMPSKYLDILEPDQLYNLNSIAFVLVNSIMGNEYALLYSIALSPLEDSIKTGSGDRIEKVMLDELKIYYPIVKVENGVDKLVITKWIGKLTGMLSELRMTNFMDNNAIVKGIKPIILEVMIMSVKERK